MSLRRQGRIIAATSVARNVIAITAVASRYAAWNANTFQANSALMRMDGTSISSRAPYGNRLPEEMLAAQAGRTRSNAAAKRTRAGARNRGPAAPQQHRP